jgi:isopentenyl phosphate kinase
MELENLREMMKRGLLPVLHGDVAMDRSRGVDIVSGDQLVAYLARSLKPEVVALGTAVDGVILEDAIVPKITPKSLSIIAPHLGNGEGIDVTGGMKGKLLELLDLAKCGVNSLIFNASKEGNVERAIKGDQIGTLVEDCK